MPFWLSHLRLIAKNIISTAAYCPLVSPMLARSIFPPSCRARDVIDANDHVMGWHCYQCYRPTN